MEYAVVSHLGTQYEGDDLQEVYIKTVAEQQKDSIDPRVYQALLEWEVHIND